MDAADQKGMSLFQRLLRNVGEPEQSPSPIHKAGHAELPFDLYLGDLRDASSIARLHSLKVERIVSMVYDHRSLQKMRVEAGEYHGIEVLGIDAQDEDYYPITQDFERCHEFIRGTTPGKAVLVHCWAGVSRSTTIVASFLMKEYGWSAKKALQYIQSRRACIVPNPGFIAQLLRFEQELKAERSGEQIDDAETAEDLDEELHAEPEAEENGDN